MISILKKYRLLIAVYLTALFFFFLKGDRFLLTHFYLLLYLFTYIFIRENYYRSRYNRDIVLLFKIFYFYLTFVLLTNSLFKIVGNTRLSYLVYFYCDMGLTFFILFISLYLLFYALNLTRYYGYRKIILLALAVSLIFVIVNFLPLLIPSHHSLNEIWPIYSKKVYYFKILSIFSLLIFWLFYYNKFIALSEYLNLVVFLFMLSNVLDALYYIGIYFKFSIFRYSQFFTLITNVLFIFVWYQRLRYLQTDLARENERYLENFLYLNGLVRKPKESFMKYILSFIPLNIVFFSLLGLMGVIFLFYITNRNTVNFYVMLNLVLIILSIMMALLFSFLSIKRDWQRQFRSLQRPKKRI